VFSGCGILSNSLLFVFYDLHRGLFLWFVQQINDLFEEATIKQQVTKKITQ